MQYKLDFASDDSEAGFRLEYFEFYNWGTYDKKIVKLELNRDNALLTGDIGSGKSTIVDAITTLLVPHQKIVYNKAAGANTKERTLYSYIVGEYKSTQDENFGSSKAVSLRDENSYTVLLGRFENSGFNESVTLAQFLYIHQKKVHKFFVLSKDNLSIKKDFIPTFESVKTLKKRLRSLKHTEVFDSFSEYQKTFSREMGIKSDQAINLFYQTVSLKSIGNLTEFIRTHMLESSDIDTKVDEICQNFATLNQTHDLVLEAIEQISLLKPIKKEYEKYQENLNNYNFYSHLRDSLELYISFFEKDLILKRLKELEIEKTKATSLKEQTSQKVEKFGDEILNIKLELQKNGADRINEIENQIKQLSIELSRAKKDNETFNSLVKSLGLRAVSNAHSFLTLRDEAIKEYESIEEKSTKLQNQITMDTVSLKNYQDKLDEWEVEIVYLRNNRSNIPQKVSKIRDALVKELSLEEADLPFVGELIEVVDEKWHPAIERVLHNTALSLLVDTKYYEKVSEYVEKTNLKGKLVYLKVDTKKDILLQPQTTPNSLLSKIDIKVDTPYHDVVKGILQERFDIPCVDSMVEFRRYKKALSINGQFKTNLTRHEKDDRFDINDKSRWVLGWDNLSKLEEFEKSFNKLKEKAEFISKRIKEAEDKIKNIQKRRDILRDVLKYEEFSKIDWYRYSKEIDRLQSEKEELLKSNDIIKTLQIQLDNLLLKEKEKKQKLESLISKIATLTQQIADANHQLSELEELQKKSLEETTKQKLDELKEDLIDFKINLNTTKKVKNILRDKIQKEITRFSTAKDKASNKLSSMQSDFKNRFPVISKEFGVGVDYGDEFIKKLDELQKDNLPKWRKKFKQLLKENTIRDIVMLQTLLEKNATDIKEKISVINRSLSDIEYNDGTFIELVAQKSNIKDIKDFRQSLKQIISGAIDENNEYDEQKFLQIKELIKRFNGREGYVDVDKKWRKLVLDVRNWYDFSARENFISDGSLKEFYAHSGGKSGGQKEKLAYTVLASSLAYQFGLEYGSVQSRSFRFVMIDEAFGRGSDESTRYALKLFEKLKLQLLVITPKQKINVIEPFVRSVHFVHNKDGMDSSLISLSIEEYQKRKSE